MESYNLHELSARLTRRRNGEVGDYEDEVEFSDATLLHASRKMPIKSYRIAYRIRPPAKAGIKIDFTKELIGVIEYLQKDKKKLVFSNGIVSR